MVYIRDEDYSPEDATYDSAPSPFLEFLVSASDDGWVEDELDLTRFDLEEQFLHKTGHNALNIIATRIGSVAAPNPTVSAAKFMVEALGLSARIQVRAGFPCGVLLRSRRYRICKRVERYQKPVTLKLPKAHTGLENGPPRKQMKKKEKKSVVAELSQMMNRMSFGDAKPSMLGPKVDNKFKKQQIGAGSGCAQALANQLESSTYLSEIAALSNLRIC